MGYQLNKKLIFYLFTLHENLTFISKKSKTLPLKAHEKGFKNLSVQLIIEYNFLQISYLNYVLSVITKELEEMESFNQRLFF